MMKKKMVRLAGGWVDETEYIAFKHEHMRIFGHRPEIDLSGASLCGHPMHAAGTMIVNAPGVAIELPFRFHDVRHDEFLSDDEDEIRPEYR